MTDDTKVTLAELMFSLWESEFLESLWEYLPYIGGSIGAVLFGTAGVVVGCCVCISPYLLVYRCIYHNEGRLVTSGAAAVRTLRGRLDQLTTPQRVGVMVVAVAALYMAVYAFPMLGVVLIILTVIMWMGGDAAAAASPEPKAMGEVPIVTVAAVGDEVDKEGDDEMDSEQATKLD